MCHLINEKLTSSVMVFIYVADFAMRDFSRRFSSVRHRFWSLVVSDLTVENDHKTLVLMQICGLILEWIDGDRSAAQALADIAALYEDQDGAMDLSLESGRLVH